MDRTSDPDAMRVKHRPATIHPAEEVTGRCEQADHGHKPDGRLRRVDDAPGSRTTDPVLVDRAWPRGLTRDKARLDLWCRQVPPSLLCKWDGHDPERFEGFGRRACRPDQG
jgi:hypothetical protein